ncbi:MAG: SocA family protein [Rhizobiales bacterium]|nr:SocA family protein [Hyphomicrobiales bacterium]
MAPWFNVRKAAQVAAYFALQDEGEINVLKLTKLIYLADRLFMEKYDRPILNDYLVSMDHGPVNSLTYGFISGTSESGDWDKFIADGAKHMVALANSKLSEDDLDELSDAELDILHSIWKSFGHMDRFVVRDYTHENCPEWENPHGSSNPIPYERVFKALGKKKSPELADSVLGDRKAISKLIS